jgi:hypothetical protein
MTLLEYLQESPPLQRSPLRIIPYGGPSEVPAVMRRTLCAGYASGVSPEQLAKVYELPYEWVCLFVLTPEGFA